jgi:two-component system chemotaxis response regulator CheB
MENLPKDNPLRLRNFEAVVSGVSAGGLEALKSLLAMLPEDFDLALVIVQHRLAQQDDFLTELLDKNCRLPVKEAQDKETVLGGVIYLAPANYHLMIETGKTFSLSTDEKVNFSRPSIDVLFETAAEAYGPDLIGIILTGASRDGATGLRRIKEKNGITIVQDPETAEYPAMPLAAMAETEVDQVLSIDRIGELLCKIGRLRATADGPTGKNKS